MMLSNRLAQGGARTLHRLELLDGPLASINKNEAKTTDAHDALTSSCTRFGAFCR